MNIFYPGDASVDVLAILLEQLESVQKQTNFRSRIHCFDYF